VGAAFRIEVLAVVGVAIAVADLMFVVAKQGCWGEELSYSQGLVLVVVFVAAMASAHKDSYSEP